MSGRNCNCASCVACTCPNGGHRCDVKATLRSRQQPRQSHYNPEDLTSVTAASYRAPTLEELRAAAAVAGKPEWSQLTKLREPVKFEATTTTQSTFRGEQNPRPQTSSGRPFFDRAESTPTRPSVPFTGTTVYSEQFVPPKRDASHAVPSDRHLKSQVELYPRGAKFDGTTTNGREFRPYEIPKPAPVIERPPPTRPNIKFEGVSQTHADYQRKARDPTQPIGHRHPEDRSKDWMQNPNKFEGISTTQDTYRGYQPPPSRPTTASHPPPLPRPSIPFTGESQTHADFQRPPLQLTRPNGQDVFRSHFQSPADLYGGRGPGSYQTETKGQFTPKSIPVCPAAAWTSPIPTPTGMRTPNNY